MKEKLRAVLGDDYRHYMLAAAIVLALFSAFSVCVFYHMRNCDHVLEYYSKSSSASMAKDLFSMPSYLYFAFLIPFFSFFYYYCYTNKYPFSLGEVLCSAFFTFMIVIALSMEHSDNKAVFLPLRAVGVDMVLQISAFIGFFSICFACLHLLYSYLDGKAVRMTNNTVPKKNTPLTFFVPFAVILLCWTPGFIACYPGAMHSDTTTALSGFFGYARMDVSFPILTTVIYGALLSLGTKLVDAAFGGFLCVLVQALINACIMAKVACDVRKYTKSNWWYLWTVLFYAVCPVWRKASVYVLKDVMHTGFFLLFCMHFFACLTEDKSRVRDAVWMGVCMILVTYTRKATFWLSVICVAVLIAFHFKKYALKYGICLALVMGMFFFCNNVLYPALNFKGEREVENYSLPFQQMAMYVCTHTNEITNEEKKIINETLDFDRILTDYTPMISDPIKHTFHAKGKDHSKFFELFFTYMKRHPLTFIKSFFMGSFEHSNPWYEGERTSNVYIAKSDDFYPVEFQDTKVRWSMNQHWKIWLDIPVLRLFIGTGFYSWILLAMVGYAGYRRSLWGFLGSFPSLVLWIGLFMSHVNGLIRYGYPLIAATPLVCAFTMYAVFREAKANRSSSAGRKEKRPLPHGVPRWMTTFGDEDDVSSAQT